MTPTERFVNLLTGKKVDRPPFMPAIYDLKPSFINVPPHLFGQSQSEISEALAFEAEHMDADAMISGYDIYNIEAECVGCKVMRDPEIFMPEITIPLINSTEDISKLKAPENPGGRMSIFIDAAKSMLEKYNGTIPVRVGTSGPFSMATRIIPKDLLLTESLISPERIVPILDFCTRTILTYVKAISDSGAGVVVFDSFVTPPMLPPELYRDLVFPFHKELFSFLEKQGVLQRSLIIGGNTGASQFLLDYNIPPEEIMTILQSFPGKVFRVKLPPGLFALPGSKEIVATTDTLLQSIGHFQNLIIGTGILAPDTPISNIMAVKNHIVNFYK
jgi:uroporphyrinogen decarboxylase